MNNNKLLPTEKELKLLEFIRNTEYGEIRIIVQEGKPIRIEEIKKSIKL
nr:DUF2292 domain-containing protein [Sedimentibacter sp.]